MVNASFYAEKLLRPLAVTQSVLLLIGLFVAIQVLANFTITMGDRLGSDYLPRTAFAAHLGRDIVAALYHHPQILISYLVAFLIGPVFFRANAAQFVLTAFVANVMLGVLFIAILVAVTAPTVIPPLLR